MGNEDASLSDMKWKHKLKNWENSISLFKWHKNSRSQTWIVLERVEKVRTILISNMLFACKNNA